MKRTIAALLMLLMIMSAGLTFGACTKNKEDAGTKAGTKASEETSEAAEDAQEEGSEDKEDAGDNEEDQKTEELAKTIKPDAEDVIGEDLPMQISEVTLYRNGSVNLTLTDDLKKNELGDSNAESIMPFAESGAIKDIFLMKIGNGGYRTLVALTEEGTISAVNTRALIEDHIVAVMDNLGGRDSFTGIEQVENEDSFSIVGKTEEGDDVVLDPLLLPEEGDVQPAE